MERIKQAVERARQERARSRQGRGRKRIAFGAMAICLLVAAGAAVSIKVLTHLTQTSAAVAERMDAPMPVRVAVVKREGMETRVGGEGVVTQSSVVPIRSKVASRIAEIPVELGDVVQQGQKLVVLDSTLQRSALRDAQEQLASARAELNLSKDKLQRLEDLFRREYVTSDELEKAMAEKLHGEQAVSAAAAKLVQTDEDLRATAVYAPGSGVITERRTHPGTIAQPYSDLMTLSVIDPVLVEVSLSEEKTRSIFLGQDADMLFYAFPGRRFTGTVAVIKPVVDEKTRTLSVLVRVANPDLSLKPGMRGVVNLKHTQEALRVPGIAMLSARDRQALVFVVDKENIAHLRPIKVGEGAGGYVEVKDGLTAGERVVVVGQAALHDKDKIQIGGEYVRK